MELLCAEEALSSPFSLLRRIITAMTTAKPQFLAQMRLMVADMERELGLADLSEPSRLLYCAAVDLAERSGSATMRTAELLHHPLMDAVSRPTFFRAMTDLTNRRLLKRSNQHTRGIVEIIQ